MDGIGPGIWRLIRWWRIREHGVKEVVLALSTGMEVRPLLSIYTNKYHSLTGDGDRHARGVGFGDDLEYTDELTLGRSIETRRDFQTLILDNYETRIPFCTFLIAFAAYTLLLFVISWVTGRKAGSSSFSRR